MTPNTPPRLFKREQVKEDLAEIYSYLSCRSEGSARRFLKECRKAFELILEMPGIGHRWESSIRGLPELRVTTVSRRFRKYLIFYRQISEGVEIVTVLHGVRNLPPVIEFLPMADVPH